MPVQLKTSCQSELRPEFDQHRVNTAGEEFLKEFDPTGQTSVDKTNISDQKLLHITYQDPLNGYQTIVNFSIKVSELGSILQSKSLDEYKAYIYNSETTSGLFLDAVSLDEKDHEIQYEVMRFVVGFLVYISAHEDKLKPIESMKMRGAEKGSNPMTINYLPEFKSTGRKAPHYRNLRHERFYRGEYESWESGTRWVPVNMNIEEAES